MFDLARRLDPAPQKADGKKMADGKIKLDDVDRQILSDLQTDGRMTNVELASGPAFPRRPVCAASECLRMVASSAAIMRISTPMRLAIRLMSLLLSG